MSVGVRAKKETTDIGYKQKDLAPARMLSHHALSIHDLTEKGHPVARQNGLLYTISD